MDAADDLYLVRRRLDSLASIRLEGPLVNEFEQSYRELCKREEELLHADFGSIR